MSKTKQKDRKGERIQNISKQLTRNSYLLCLRAIHEYLRQFKHKQPNYSAESFHVSGVRPGHLDLKQIFIV